MASWMGVSVTSRYTWLARTAQNLAPFDLQPPAGFTQRQRSPRIMENFSIGSLHGCPVVRLGR